MDDGEKGRDVGLDRLLFVAASGLSEEGERRVFLEYVCRGDAARLERLGELLRVRGEADAFFDMPHVRAGLMTVVQDVPADPLDGGGLGVRIGPYVLRDRLGAGGCGVVYLAEQEEPVKRKVALKIIRLGMDTESVIARFAMERQALALMDHPNIARVLDAGSTASGRPYFVMEWVEGEKITDFCDRHRLGLRQRLELFVQVCAAIQHAHQKGVIHRDIKPSNVLVRDQEGRAEPKVIDFGIAKATAGGLGPAATVTRSGEFIGTPAYVSPEQAAGDADIDTRSDIYSLGCLLCELLTGTPPIDLSQFADRTPGGIRDLLRDGGTRMPSSQLRGLSVDEVRRIAAQRSVDPQSLPLLLAGDLDWIVMKAVEKDRGMRYETAEGLAMDVRRHLGEQPVLARPPSRADFLRKLVRRNRAAFAAAVVALLGLLGGLGASTWLLVREREARNEQARMRVVAEQAVANEIVLRQGAEAVDRVARAAVHVKYNELTQADRLLGGMAVGQAPRTLEAANTFKSLAEWSLSQARWEQAAGYSHLLIHVLTRVDMQDSKSISYDLMPALTAVREWGDPGQYEEDRSLVIRRFANTANQIVAEQVMKSTLMADIGQEDLHHIQPLAGVVEASLAGGGGRIDPHMTAWRQFSLALLAYRSGDGDGAGEWARKSLATADNSQARNHSNRVLLAMVDLKQGRLPEARAALRKVRTAVENWESVPFRLQAEDGGMWSNWGIVRILLKEAEQMPQNKAFQ